MVQLTEQYLLLVVQLWSSTLPMVVQLHSKNKIEQLVQKSEQPLFNGWAEQPMFKNVKHLGLFKFQTAI